MTKFNKSLLTAAVVGALALPGLASAASLGYPTAAGSGKQLHFAKDLLVNDGTTIYVPSDLTFVATTDDATRIATVDAGGAGTNVTFKVTLTNGAKFDSTADATTLVEGFLIGAQLGGAAGGTPVATANLVGTPYYSATGQELNFTINALGAGSLAGAGDFALKLNSMQITNLVTDPTGLYLGGSISAQITAQNQVGQQILASKAVIARSVWGLDISSDLTGVNTNTTIDVAASGSGASAVARKTRFSPAGLVGGAAAAGAANELFVPGAIVIDITEAAKTDGVDGYVNNFSAVALEPEYNVVSTAVFNIDVIGSNLTAFAGGNISLDSVATCDSGNGEAGSINAAGTTASFELDASSPLLASVTNAPPSGSTLYVCLTATDKEMVPQALKASVGVDYQLSTQRRNPEPVEVALAPLKLNGATLVFQNVNPAGNATAQSFLRITNNNADVCPITIDAKDDAGRHSGEVKLTLGAHESKQINSEVLEGNASQAGITGGFGDGTGKWYVRVTAECSNFKASALNRHQDGVVTNLTPEKEIGDEWLTPSTSL